jgi:WD40 repeat protein
MNVVKDPYPYFECLNTLNGHLGEVTFVAFGSNDRTLVSGSLKTIKVWNLETGEEITTLIKVSRCSNIGHIALSADRQILVCTNGRGIIKVWNLNRTYATGISNGAPSAKRPKTKLLT